MERGLEVAIRERRSPRSAEPALAVSVFGPFSASCRGKPIEIKLRKGAAVLGYLCMQENLTARRDRLAFLLWSESDNNSARTSLRQTLISLRRAFGSAGFNGFKTTKSTVSLDPNSTDIDFKRVVGATDEGRIDDALFAVERLPETLLEGMEELDEEFRMWLLPTRQALHNRLERVLSAQLNDSAAPEPSKVLVAHALLRIDPTNEAALQHEVLSFAQRGDVSGAVRLYRRFETLLATDYDLRPSAELQMLVARIQKEGAVRYAVPADSRLADEFSEARPERRGARHTIVIRLDPFAVQGVDPTKSYLITGFRHALTASLVRFREWIIVDGGQEATNSKPDFDYALQATLYEVDGSIEVVLTLLQLQNSAYVWSDNVRLRLDKWLATQHDIIRGIATTLQVHISAERLNRSFDRGEISVTAFDQWLRAQAAAFSLQGSLLHETRQTLIAVARSNPTYSPLFSALAQFDNVESLLRPGVFRSPEVAQSAVENARRAVQLDAVDSRAHLALGWAYAFKWDFDAATQHMRLAVELNESDPWPHVSAALFWALAHHGEMASESLASFSNRSKAHTGAETGYLAQIHFLNGEFALAVSVFERKQLVLPIDLAWTAAALALSGRVAEAQNRAREFVSKAQAAWAGPLKPTEEHVVSWLMHAHPFRHLPHWTTMREGLERAGLPVRHLVHALYFGADHRQ